MVFGKKNRPLVLSATDSNYTPAPSPSALKPQPAIGKEYTQEANEFPNQKNKVPPKYIPYNPVEQLANSYNDSHRPLPKLIPEEEFIRQKQREERHKQKQQHVTIINNYYGQPPPQNQHQVNSGYPSMPKSPTYSSQKQQQIPVNNHRYSSSESTQSRSHQHHQNQYTSPHKQQPQQRSTSAGNFNYDTNRDDFSERSSISSRSFTSLNQAGRKDAKKSIRMASNTSEETNYDAFVKKTSNSAGSSPSKSTRDSFHKTINDIYASPAISSDQYKYTSTRNNNHNIIAPKIPIVDVDLDDDSVDNLFDELKKFADFSVHDDKLLTLFQNCCASSLYMTLEELGSILYDPYYTDTRFSFKNLKIIMETFTSSANKNYTIDFRSFVSMCKFIKGCFVSFNYHDKRGGDHVLDFEEFTKALRSNKIACSDAFLAKTFANGNAINLENYIIAIIIIRKHRDV